MAGTCCLPHEVIFHDILTRLPATILVRFKCVSKLWCKSITDPHFAKAHLHQWRLHQWRCLPPGLLNNYALPEGKKFLSFSNEITKEDNFYLRNLNDIIPNEKTLFAMASCDGLLVVGAHQRRRSHYGVGSLSYYIINPVNGSHMKLSPPPTTFWNCALVTTNDGYETVGWNVGTMMHGNQEVYVFKAGGYWTTYCLLGGTSLPGYTPAAFKGCLHWVDCRETVMRSFDIASGKITEMTLPCEVKDRCWWPRVAVIRGVFYLVQFYVHGNGRGGCYVIWSLEDWETQNWSKVYRRKCKSCCQCDGSSQPPSSDGDLIFREIIRISKGSDAPRDCSCQELQQQPYEDIVHFNTLVSLDNCKSATHQ